MKRTTKGPYKGNPNQTVPELREEWMETLSYLQLSHHAAIMILVKSLEEAGALDREHYQANLRMFSESLGYSVPIKALLYDLADLLDREGPEGEA